MSDSLLSVLSNLGLGLATNAIYDSIKKIKNDVSKTDLTKEIQQKIELCGVTMRAETIIEALAKNGFLLIRGSRLHANNQLIFGSIYGRASIGDDSFLSTNRTSIEIGKGAIETKGNAQIRQNPDGSITFHT